ncbi:hypothetical protein OC846_006530 [Tilletia horrida]|uniref:Uncharacterized protein n=1 Tax=Tilletia horrida TaxID=155126 RepID=A0AAN6GIN7_9BASI|nr:hypothetical protein OC846_006530 [Tilletia horrida]
MSGVKKFFDAIGQLAFWLSFFAWYRVFGKNKQLPPTPPLPAPLPEDAPLTHEQKPFRYQNPPGNPNALVRRLWGAELFFWVFSKWTDGAFDIIGTWNFSAPEVDLRKYARAAWIRCRFQNPQMAVKVVKGALPDYPAHLPYWSYHIPQSFAEVEAWADATFHFIEQEDGKDDDQVAEEWRLRLQQEKIDDEHLFRCYIYIGKESNRFLIHFSHACGDGASAFINGSQFYSALNDSLDIDLNEQVRNLPWGKEVADLPPSLPDAMGLGPTVNDQDVMVELLKPLLEGHLPSLTLVPQRKERQGPIGVCRVMRVTLDPAEVKQLGAVMKSVGCSLSHAFDAARHTAIYYMRAKDAEERGLKYKETHLVNFLAPIECRRFFQGRHRGKPYVTMANVCFNTEVPLAGLGRKEGQSDADWRHDVFETCLKTLVPQFAAVQDEWRLVTALAGGVSLFGVEKPLDVSAALTAEPGDSYTSIGRIESLIKLEYKTRSGQRSVRVNDFGFSPRQTNPSMCLHSWSMRGNAVFSANYNDCYDEEYTRLFLDTILSVLREAARRGAAAGAAAQAAKKQRSPGAAPAARL